MRRLNFSIDTLFKDQTRRINIEFAQGKSLTSQQKLDNTRNINIDKNMKTDFLLLGFYTRLSCILEWNLLRAKWQSSPSPLSHSPPTRWINWPINDKGSSNLKWRQTSINIDKIFLMTMSIIIFFKSEAFLHISPYGLTSVWFDCHIWQL